MVTRIPSALLVLEAISVKGWNEKSADLNHRVLIMGCTNYSFVSTIL